MSDESLIAYLDAWFELKGQPRQPLGQESDVEPSSEWRDEGGES